MTREMCRILYRQDLNNKAKCDPELVILVGIQGSGKSTFYNKMFAETHVRVSKDLMRSRKRKEARQQRWIREVLDRGQSVVVDNTNPDPETRAPLIHTAKEYGVRVIAFYFPPSLEECLERNEQRPQSTRVPLVGVFATLKKLTVPKPEEGFDQVFEVHWREGRPEYELKQVY